MKAHEGDDRAVHEHGLAPRHPGVAVAQTTTTAPAQEKKTEEKDHRDEASDVSGEGGERPGPQRPTARRKFVATSKTGKAVTQRRKEEKS